VCTRFYPRVVRSVSGNGQETFLTIFCPATNLSQWNLGYVCTFKKMQIYGCKQVFNFEKFRKVPLGKFPPEKNSLENISDNFVKFRKFFPTEEHFGKFQENFHKILIIKSIIYRL
jgi:hypothetical protein